jgi:hypothetical protein
MPAVTPTSGGPATGRPTWGFRATAGYVVGSLVWLAVTLVAGAAVLLWTWHRSKIGGA